MDILKNYNLVIEDCLCDNITKKQFFDLCIPFFNMETFNAFLLYEDIDNDSLTSINTPNSFVVKNNCLKESDSKGYILRFNNSDSKKDKKDNYLESICFDSTISNNKFKLDNTIPDVSNFIISNINYEFNLSSDYKIPFYYFLLKPEDIFNVFIIKNNNIAKNLFVIEKDSQKFISISDSVNIFNLSIFTYKFFDIMNIFHELFKIKGTSHNNTITKSKRTISKDEKDEKDQDQDFIKGELKKIFDPIQHFITAIWNLYKFRLFISGIGNTSVYKNDECNYTSEESCDSNKCKWNNTKKSCVPLTLRDMYLNIPVSKCNFDYDNEEEKEFWKKTNKRPKIYEYEKDIIPTLAEEIIKIRNALCDISESIEIPEYKYIFLIQLLGYRLICKKFLAGSWGFLYSKYIDILIKNKDNKKLIDNQNLENIFNNKLPTIYEYGSVSFKNQNYGNCMENTILQFFKLLFWDINESKINIKAVEKLIRPRYKENMLKFMENIKVEKEQLYANRWVEFISYTLSQDKTHPIINYSFAREGTESNGQKVSIELDTTFENLYLALIKLLNIPEEDKLNAKDTKSRIEILNKFLKDNINLSFITEIKLTLSNYRDLINVYTKIKPYTIELLHSPIARHAYFVEALSKNKIYILVNDPLIVNSKSISKGLALVNKNNPLFYTNFIQYVFLKILLSERHHENSDLFKFYKNTIPDEILTSIYQTLCSDIYIKQLNSINEIILKNIPEIINDITYWKGFLVKKQEPKFWEDAFNNQKNLDLFTEQNLWQTIIKGEIFNRSLLVSISENQKILDVFTTKDLWRDVLEFVIIDKFWENIVKNQKILDVFTEKGLWPYMIRYFTPSIFWINISKNQTILDVFTEKNLWSEIIQCITPLMFWENISQNKKILDIFTEKNLWSEIKKNINYRSFWENISKNETLSKDIKEFKDKITMRDEDDDDD